MPRIHFGFYCVFLKEIKCGDLKYGCNYYDYQEGTLVFIAPGQVVGIDNDRNVQCLKDGLAFSSRFNQVALHLAIILKDYTFFSYEANEALHLSEKETTNCNGLSE